MFQDIHFVKNSFFKKSENITGAIFTLNYKYATFFIYALALLVLGRYLYVSDFIYCDNMHNAISSKEMINGFCFHQGIFTISFTKKVRYKCPTYVGRVHMIIILLKSGRGGVSGCSCYTDGPRNDQKLPSVYYFFLAYPFHFWNWLLSSFLHLEEI